MKYFLTLFLTALALNVNAQQSLQLEKIMTGDDFVGNQPLNHRWSIDGKTILFDWNPNKEIGTSTYFWNPNRKEPQKANNEIIFTEDFYTNQKQFQEVYFLKQGNLYVYNKATKKEKPIWIANERISRVERSSNPDVLFLEMNRNIYQLNTKFFSIQQLTNFKSGKETLKKEDILNFLEQQQKELFLFINEQEARSKYYKQQSESPKRKLPKEIYYNNFSLETIKISSNGKFVTFRLSDYPNQTSTNVEHFITKDGFTESRKARAKVSDKNLSEHKFGIFNVAKDTVYFVDFSKLSGIQSHPKYYQDYENLKDKEEKPQQVIMQSPIYSDDNKNVVMELRSMDNKHRWIVLLDLASGKITELDHQHDEAWIGGPGIPSYGFGNGTLGFINNNTIYFQSEVTGFSHLYTLDLNSKKKVALTSGNWEVRNAQLSNDKKAFYLTTTTTHPGNRSFYKLDIASKKMTGIFTNDGAYEVEIAPDEKSFLVRYSFKNQPWELFYAENQPNAKLQQITFSTTKEFQQYQWQAPEIVTFTAQDGKTVYARLYEPKNGNKNKAAVIFVHGAGYLQNAHNYWSTYHREFMFHHLLSDLGYTVLDIDYRASDGYGRDFRTGIYRHMGGLDLQDHLDGKKYLVNQHQIDSKRVGIYGGSYGGFITLMALLTEPGEFKSGAALRAVTDWAHYNQGYTSNILNFPETDPLAYQKSSPIYFAENLQDRLLMLHGMVDDNVQFQDIVRLSQRFIELGKKDWDLAVYPVEAHGFQKTYSWVDEYRRILDLFNETLLEN